MARWYGRIVVRSVIFHAHSDLNHIFFPFHSFILLFFVFSFSKPSSYKVELFEIHVCLAIEVYSCIIRDHSTKFDWRSVLLLLLRSRIDSLWYANTHNNFEMWCFSVASFCGSFNIFSINYLNVFTLWLLNFFLFLIFVEILVDLEECSKFSYSLNRIVNIQPKVHHKTNGSYRFKWTNPKF